MCCKRPAAGGADPAAEATSQRAERGAGQPGQSGTGRRSAQHARHHGNPGHPGAGDERGPVQGPLPLPLSAAAGDAAAAGCPGNRPLPGRPLSAQVRFFPVLTSPGCDGQCDLAPVSVLQHPLSV